MGFEGYANSNAANGWMPEELPNLTTYEQALKFAGKTFELYLYEGVNHAFNNDTNAARYDEKAVWMDELKPAFGDSFFFEAEEENLYGERYHDSFPDDFE